MPVTFSSKAASRPAAGLLLNRNFVLLWCAYGISALGDHISEMALLKTQNALSPEVDTTSLDARITFLFFVPFFLFGPFTGYLADRLPRRGLMIFADLVRCALMFSFFAFIEMIRTSTSWETWGPLLPLLLVGTFAVVFSPAREALLPTLIRREQLVRANGMMSGLGIIATMFAIWIGGFLVDHYNASLAFKVDGLTFVGSVTFLLFLRPPKRRALAPAGRPLGSAISDLVDGFKYVLCHRRVIELLAVATLVWFCGPFVKCVMPAIVRDVYQCTHYQDISAFRVYLGAGFILGAVTISILGGALRSEIAITWGLFGIAASIVIFALSVFLPFSSTTLYAIGAVGVVGAGFFAVAVMASFNALLQRIVPDRYRGRVFGLKNLVCVAALLVATGALGVPQWMRVDRWVGYILVFVAVMTCGAGMVTLSIRLRRSPQRRALTIAQHFNEFFAKFWWRLERVGRPTIPREGPVIVTANHVTAADPLFLHAAAPYRGISFMVAAEYVEVPFLRPIFRLNDCIPVKRDGRDTAGTKMAIRHLRDGKAVGIFIEGRIINPGEEPDLKDGVAMLALKTGTKVIPAHISGVVRTSNVLKGLLSRHRVRVRFGQPVDLSDFKEGGRENLRAATQRIYAAINALAP